MQDDIKQLKFAIIIPAFNEEKFIVQCLDSLTNQSLKPKSIIVVDDSSTDDTPKIIKKFHKEYNYISYVLNPSATLHEPGQKVINAFYKGFEGLNINEYDVICKFDADLIFPKNYLEKINKTFLKDNKIGLCGGFCSILEENQWQTENLTNKDHIRGALKAYRINAFNDIGGLSKQMGWDTADEIKLRYQGWEVQTIKGLSVKHLKSTGDSYTSQYYRKQGQVFYGLRYGMLLSIIAAFKMANKRGEFLKGFLILKYFRQSKKKHLKFLLSHKEGQFLRQYRWKQIWKKLKICNYSV